MSSNAINQQSIFKLFQLFSVALIPRHDNYDTLRRWFMDDDFGIEVYTLAFSYMNAISTILVYISNQ